MSYAIMGDKPLEMDIEITKQFAFNLESLLRGYFEKRADKGDMTVEGIMAQASLLTDRLTDLAAQASEQGEAGAARISLVERPRQNGSVLGREQRGPLAS